MLENSYSLDTLNGPITVRIKQLSYLTIFTRKLVLNSIFKMFIATLEKSNNLSSSVFKVFNVRPDFTGTMVLIKAISFHSNSGSHQPIWIYWNRAIPDCVLCSNYSACVLSWRVAIPYQHVSRKCLRYTEK